MYNDGALLKLIFLVGACFLQFSNEVLAYEIKVTNNTGEKIRVITSYGGFSTTRKANIDDKQTVKMSPDLAGECLRSVTVHGLKTKGFARKHKFCKLGKLHLTITKGFSKQNENGQNEQIVNYSVKGIFDGTYDYCNKQVKNKPSCCSDHLTRCEG